MVYGTNKKCVLSSRERLRIVVLFRKKILKVILQVTLESSAMGIVIFIIDIDMTMLYN